MSICAFSVFNKFLKPQNVGIATKETIRLKRNISVRDFFSPPGPIAQGNVLVKTKQNKKTKQK